MNIPNWIRKVLVIITILIIWQIAAILTDAPLILPTFTETAMSFERALTSTDGNLLQYIYETSRSLFVGFGIGTLAVSSPRK